MILSILIIGKNDSYGQDKNGYGGVNKRLEITLNNLIDNLNKLNKDDIEVVLCDWGSEHKIIDNLIFNKCKNFKSVYVPNEICLKYNPYFSISHSYNVAYKNSIGSYVIFWDSDCFIDYDSFKNLYEFVKDLDIKNIKNNFWWSSRGHIPRNGYIYSQNFKDVDLYIKENPNLIEWQIIDTANFYGNAIAILLPRKIAEESSCWYEKLPNWGWQDIELHNRLIKKYQCGGDLFNNGIKMYHLYHHDVNDTKAHNPRLNSLNFHANENNWGLMNEFLEVKYLI